MTGRRRSGNNASDTRGLPHEAGPATGPHQVGNQHMPEDTAAPQDESTAGGTRPGGAWTPRRRTGVVGLAVPDLEEPYFAELTGLLARRAAEHGLSIVIRQTAGDHQAEVDVANGLGLPPTDGLIHIPRSLTVADLTRRTDPGPLVLLGEHIRHSPFAHVSIDNRAAAVAATEHLVAHGCRRIATVGPRFASPSDAADQRYAGYCEVVARHDLVADGDLVRPVAAFTSDEGYRAMQEMLATCAPPDGVVCSNDSLAFGVLRALHEHGLAIPEDVAVIGIDDVHASRFTEPPLSSVAPDKEALVDAALRILERQLAAPVGSDMPVEQVTIGFRLADRRSTAR